MQTKVKVVHRQHEQSFFRCVLSLFFLSGVYYTCQVAFNRGGVGSSRSRERARRRCRMVRAHLPDEVIIGLGVQLQGLLQPLVE